MNHPWPALPGYPHSLGPELPNIGLRTQLPFFAANVDSTITLFTGEVGDEGWFILPTTPDSWQAAGPDAYLGIGRPPRYPTDEPDVQRSPYCVNELRHVGAVT